MVFISSQMETYSEDAFFKAINLSKQIPRIEKDLQPAANC